LRKRIIAIISPKLFFLGNGFEPHIWATMMGLVSNCAGSFDLEKMLCTFFYLFSFFSKRARNVSNFSAFYFFQKGSTTGISQLNLRSKLKKVNGVFSKSKLPEEFVTSPIIVAQIWGSEPFPKKNFFSKKNPKFHIFNYNSKTYGSIFKNNGAARSPLGNNEQVKVRIRYSQFFFYMYYRDNFA